MNEQTKRAHRACWTVGHILPGRVMGVARLRSTSRRRGGALSTLSVQERAFSVRPNLAWSAGAPVPRFYLLGTRGARYSLWCSRASPDVLFAVNDRTHGAALDGFRFHVQPDGSLVARQHCATLPRPRPRR